MRRHEDFKKILQRFEAPKRRMPVWPVVLGFILVIVFVAFMFWPQELNETEFIARAQACKPAGMIKSIGTTTLKLSINSDCSITKRVVDISPMEPEAVRHLFFNTEIICAYEKGNFDTRHVTQISGNLAMCTGTIADAVLAVI